MQYSCRRVRFLRLPLQHKKFLDVFFEKNRTLMVGLYAENVKEIQCKTTRLVLQRPCAMDHTPPTAVMQSEFRIVQSASP